MVSPLKCPMLNHKAPDHVIFRHLHSISLTHAFSDSNGFKYRKELSSATTRNDLPKSKIMQQRFRKNIFNTMQAIFIYL